MLALTETKPIVLRDYQSQAIEELRETIRSGRKRPVLCAGTGAGKTVIGSHLLQEAARKGSYSLFVVDRLALIKQTSAVFDTYGIAHGVIQGIHPRWSPHEHIQLCSTQTLTRRGLPRTPKLIVVDEAHCLYRGALDLMKTYPDAVVVGLTATPTPGMAAHYDEDVVNVRPTRLLIQDGFLVEPTIYVARSPDDSEFRLNNFGEFSDSSAGAAGIRIVGDVVTEWIKKTGEHFGGPVKTIVFCATVDHGREICAAFAAAGHNFQLISHHDRDEDRDGKIEEFRRPDSVITGLVSCAVLTKGFDVPDCLVGISCRPYSKSCSSHIQEIGRIMRPHPGKTKCLWLDHSGNIERFAADMFDFWERGVDRLSGSGDLDKKPRKRTEQTRAAAVCPECNGALRGNTCLACGWERSARSGIVATDGELHEFRAPTCTPRAGLRAEVLKQPQAVWDAALLHCLMGSADPEKARKRAYAIWRGIYPADRMPSGWWGRSPALASPDALALIEREVRRFRKLRRAA